MTQTEWDNTAWAGQAPATIPESRALVVPQRPMVKAVTGPGVSAILNDTPLSSFMGQDPQERAKRFLQAYRVGWFFKAGRRISQDVGALEVRLAYQDSELNGDETRITDPGLQVPLDQLEPEVQLLRLLAKPNPHQSGRALRQEAQIRLDFAGATALWLEGVGDDEMALPTAIYGISPARMWPSRDKKGNLIGWVMDWDGMGNGVPFSVNEIIWINNASEKDGDIWGTSVVEAVYAEVPLTALMARHTADVLTTGGRLAGMLWPKDRSLDEGEYQDALRAWRNVANDPNAARRLLMFPEPMEFSNGAATPAEIGIPQLANLHQTQVLSAFPMSPQMLGIPAPAGLNSGETRRWDRKEYWEGTVHPRADLLAEAMDRSLVGRYERIIDKPLVLSLVERALDDPAALVEKAGAMRSLINLGFDARDSIVAVGLTGIKWNGLPLSMDPNAPMDALQSQGNRTGGLRVLAGDTNHSDSAVIQQELVGSRKGIDGDDLIARLRVGLPGNKAARLAAGVPEGLLEGFPDPEQALALYQLIATGIKRGYSIDQIVEGYPGEKYLGVKAFIDGLNEGEQQDV